MKAQLLSRIVRHRAGFTLIESVIGATLMSGVLLMIGLALDTTFSAYRMAESESQADQAAHRALEDILRNISDAGAGTLGDPTGAFGSSDLSFRRAALYDAAGEAIGWGSESQIGWQLEPGELNDGIDNDGDGLIDEGEIFWLLDVGEPTQRRVVKVKSVAEYLGGEEPNLADDNDNGLIDEAGLDFQWDGAVLTVRLTLLAVGPKGMQLTRTVQSSTRLRN
ncbi:MAG: type II secretory pathway pseudopilin PulG [Planctomycetota bacterium]|jgi:type II secretory pathway pseudopilin PulG